MSNEDKAKTKFTLFSIKPMKVCAIHYRSYISQNQRVRYSVRTYIEKNKVCPVQYRAYRSKKQSGRYSISIDTSHKIERKCALFSIKPIEVKNKARALQYRSYQSEKKSVRYSVSNLSNSKPKCALFSIETK